MGNAINFFSKINLYWNKDAFFHTIWHLIGTLTPLLIIFVISYFSPGVSITKFIKEGDFSLFSTAILTPAAYLLSTLKNKEKKKSLTLPEIVSSLSIIIVIIAILMFTLNYLHQLFPVIKLITEKMVTPSWIFLIFSVFAFYYSQALLQMAVDGNMKISEEHNVDNLEAKLKLLKSQE